MEKDLKINYIIGDATAPVGEGKKYIVHICNNIGAWGSGFVTSISNKWKNPEREYKKVLNYYLGTYEIIVVENDISIVNIIGQEGIKRQNAHTVMPPVRYIAIETALNSLADKIVLNNQTVSKGSEISVHMPRIGSDRAGGNWNVIECIINETLIKKGVPVTVYDLPK